MPTSNFVGLFAVQQNVSNLEKQLNLYGNIGFVVDESAELDDGHELPDEWFSARGVSRQDLAGVHALKLPGDAYMHVWMYSWKNLVTDAQWPQKPNQIGSRGLTLLFDDAEVELLRLLKGFPETKVLHKAIRIQRRWGETTSILVQDPEGTFVELISIKENPLIARAVPPAPHQRSFLHFMLNCLNFPATSKWYRSFGGFH
ncbi:hypothetical protein LTR13_011431 [Exophiala sideris]|uniref:VOC domain-containing protein n=1 Tax=Exophiala sideris TaxID=1016849 RepID=A0ABR0IU45_9EURO|nr:hypothetical protein LTR13_011431 [Exophiala sideris]KAK5048103.1 hypothetical protein LTR69_011466 [Exophiala sideris]KAK5175979.1 hypothetical protein LTR44_011465 [Eurotiomycetes sp. CCFEE 6388]